MTDDVSKLGLWL